MDMRKRRNETQQDVANAIGVTRQYYALIEDGSRQRRMDITLAGLISGHFGVAIGEIVAQEQALHKAESASGAGENKKP